MRYFTGIDVSLRSVSICVVDEAGEVCHEAKVAAEVDVIVATLQRFSAEIKQVGFEAGTLERVDEGQDEAANVCCAQSATKSEALLPVPTHSCSAPAAPRTTA